MPPVAFITGIAGQDGSYLAQLLLEQGYEVHGMVRRLPGEVTLRIASLRDRVTLHQADLADQPALVRLLERVQPREVYNLAAQSFVPTSWADPIEDGESTAIGVVKLLEAIRTVNTAIRLFQAGSSEMFGVPREEPQNEETPFRPHTPYGASKLYAHWLCVSYREKYGLFAANGVLFNHESPLRSERFVSRKVSRAAAAIKRGQMTQLRLGNLDGRRDWGFAGDFARAMWLMLQQAEPDDYVIATGQTHTVRELVELAFGHVGLDWREYVEVDPALVRTDQGAVRRGNTRKAQAILGWRTEVSFEKLVAMMVDADTERLS